ncbi:hypothetical protein J437_LFUL008609 [Ladona fulva]|uniref:Heparan sulfate 2-O-sulfotransferase pipe n=1 Tax=Ladona fulva TaxID=123851 RepID=A0A8K0KCW0_LADFU|nr:hypothetical protein J437_LFUL008609 [Ladona fulva]
MMKWSTRKIERTRILFKTAKKKMKFKRVYPLAIVAVLILYASFTMLNIILPSFVSLSETAAFERGLKVKPESQGDKSLKSLLSPKGFLNNKISDSDIIKTKRHRIQFEGSSNTASAENVMHDFNRVSSVTPSSRHVTKSLEELGYVSGRVNPDFLFFNRVPKCGSEMLVLLLQWLQGLNGFKHVRLGGGKIRRLKRLQQEEVVEEVIQHEKEALPLSFDRHVYWLNFSAFDHSTPVWINLIRDPIEKAASRFYYAKELNEFPGRKDAYKSFEECVESGKDMNCRFIDGEMYDLSIPYFCGHEKWCMALNDQWALEEAKTNVERHYNVVGVLEEINVTLAVLEKQLPRFFSGVQDMYFHELLEPHHNKNRKRPRGIRADLQSYLKSVLKLEYEFYNFIKSRLFNQYKNFKIQA